MKKFSLFVSIVLLSLNLVACGTSTPALTQVSAQQNTSLPVASSSVFQVVKADGSKFDMTLDALKKLPLANITVDGKVQEGPKLLDVITLAGVTDFTEVTLTGSASPVTLTRAQVDDNTILDFNNHGTLKLATAYVPMPNWTKDISEITVK
jgi:hypothetical protein